MLLFCTLVVKNFSKSNLFTFQLNCVNEGGLTALMLSCCRGDVTAVKCLLDAGADPNIETPALSHVETQYWTALCYTALQVRKKKSFQLSQCDLLNGSPDSFSLSGRLIFLSFLREI